MELQKQTLSQFYEVYEKPSLKTIASMTGIQLTRVHRLFKGSKMKLIEYEIFKKFINNKKGVDQLTLLAQKCEAHLSALGLNEIEELMERKLRLWNLKYNY